jgi:hypothetical protein
MPVQLIIPTLLSLAIATVLARSARTRALVWHAIRHPLQEATIIEWSDGNVEVRPKERQHHRPEGEYGANGVKAPEPTLSGR